MNHTLHSLATVALHTVAIYAFLIVALRVLGFRQLGQLTVVDLVIIIVLGSAVETSMVAGNTTLLAGIVSASTLLLMNRVISAVLYHSPRLRHLVSGSPILLFHQGQFIGEHLRRAGLTESDVLQAIRERGEEGTQGIAYVVREVDGSINVVPKEGPAKDHDAPEK